MSKVQLAVRLVEVDAQGQPLRTVDEEVYEVNAEEPWFATKIRGGNELRKRNPEFDPPPGHDGRIEVQMRD